MDYYQINKFIIHNPNLYYFYRLLLFIIVKLFLFVVHLSFHHLLTKKLNKKTQS